MIRRAPTTSGAITGESTGTHRVTRRAATGRSGARPAKGKPRTPAAIATDAPRSVVTETALSCCGWCDAEGAGWAGSLPGVAVDLRHRDEAGVGEPGGPVLGYVAVLRAGRHLEERLTRRVLDEDDGVPLVVLAADHHGVGPALPQDPAPDLLEHRADTFAVAGVRIATRSLAIAAGALGEPQQVQHDDRG